MVLPKVVFPTANIRNVCVSRPHDDEDDEDEDDEEEDEDTREREREEHKGTLKQQSTTAKHNSTPKQMNHNPQNRPEAF